MLLGMLDVHRCSHIFVHLGLLHGLRIQQRLHLDLRSRVRELWAPPAAIMITFRPSRAPHTWPIRMEGTWEG